MVKLTKNQILVGTEGIAPIRFAIEGPDCVGKPAATPIYPDILSLDWWAQKESNLRPLSYQDNVLPLNYVPTNPVMKFNYAYYFLLNLL